MLPSKSGSPRCSCLFLKHSTVVTFRQITVSCGRKRVSKVRVYYETPGSILRPRNENLVFDPVVGTFLTTLLCVSANVTRPKVAAYPQHRRGLIYSR